MKKNKEKIKINYNGIEYQIDLNNKLTTTLLNQTFANVIRGQMLLAYMDGESFKLDRDVIDVDDVDFTIIDIQNEIHRKEYELEELKRKMNILKDLKQNLTLICKPFDQIYDTKNCIIYN